MFTEAFNCRVFLSNSIKYRFQRLKEVFHMKRFSSLNRSDNALLQV